FLDVVSCQSTFDVFADFDEARFEALGNAAFTQTPAQRTVHDTFGGRVEASFSEEPESPPEPTPPADETPPTFTTLDQVLIRSVIASVADVLGALSTGKVEDLVEVVIQLNLDRHQCYFLRGLLTVLRDRPPELVLPEASVVRLG